MNFMPDHTYFDATVFRSLFYLKHLLVLNALERKRTRRVQDPNYFCKSIVDYPSRGSIFPQRMSFLLPNLPCLPQPSGTKSACKLLPRLMVYTTHQVSPVPPFKISKQKHSFIFTFYFSSRSGTL